MEFFNQMLDVLWKLCVSGLLLALLVFVVLMLIDTIREMRNTGRDGVASGEGSIAGKGSNGGRGGDAYVRGTNSIAIGGAGGGKGDGGLVVVEYGSWKCTRCGRRTPIDHCPQGPCPMEMIR